MTNRKFANKLREIKADRTSGAAELARRCLQIMAESSEQDDSDSTAKLLHMLNTRIDLLVQARPSMAPVFNLLHSFRHSIMKFSCLTPVAARKNCADTAGRIITASLRATDKTATHAAALIGNNETVFTHSYSSTVLQAFARQHQKELRVVISESRPLCEGNRMAEKLSGLGIPSTLITDAQTGLFVREADIVLVGADTILPDLSVVNKAGTYLLALAAKDIGIPVYVCSETYKQIPPGTPDPVLESMDPAELDAPELPHLTVANIYFDITPSRLVTGWINEKGVQPVNP